MSGQGASEDHIKNQILDNIDTTYQKKAAEQLEKRTLEQSLRILKVINFLYCNPDIISERGMNFIMNNNEADG